MKKILFLVLALVLASCAPVAPVVQPTAAIPPTPVVLVATVLVPVVQTQLVQATAAPTNPPAPIPTVEAPTLAPTTGAAVNPSVGGGTATATLPANAGGLSKAGEVLFTNLTRSGSYFNLRCAPQELTFGVSTSNVYVVEVDLFYRMEDLTTQPITISPWKNAGKMTGDKNGNYTISVNTLQKLSPDLRASAKSWFDYQYIGIAKDGNSVGNSGIISQQVLYLKDCP